MKNEEIFERDLIKFGKYFGCMYIKIPDTKMINKFNRKNNREMKRPFDGIMVTKKQNFCIECKFGNNVLKDHQRINQDIINEINKSFYVLRMKMLKKGVNYTIEQPEKNVILNSEKIEDIFKFFNGV